MEQLGPGAEHEKWLNYLALTTIILAVCATLASFKEGNNSVDTVLNQTQAANQWSYFQSKSIKGYLYEMQRDKLQVELDAGEATLPPRLREAYAKKIDMYTSELARYAEEKKEIMAEAKKYEKERDITSRRQEAFGIAVVFLQMGILLSSVGALMKRKSLWIAGCAVGAVGVIYFVDGFVLFVT
ncbi:MAG: DUF4337 domain-containing protein [Deltaproteobacteria bacterium]|nr:DUF4337 domain-containing protein [Deltaproteobacteria bacterium]